MDQPPPIIESPPGAPQASPTSLAARLLNVLATPGEVFEEVKVSRPSIANWLVPTLLFGLASAMSFFLILSQPAIVQQMRERQEKVFEDQVKAGKMTQQQADNSMAMVEKYSGPIAKIGGAVGGFFMGFVAVFGWGFLLWLIGRFALKAELDFMKMIEIAGLASVISVLDTLVRMLLVFGFSNPLASPSLGLLMKNPDPKNALFVLLSLVNIMTFWALAVRSIGLAKLSGVPFGKAAVWVFGIWVVITTLMTSLGLAAQKTFGG